MGSTVVIGVVDDGVVGIALHGLVKAGENLVSIILAILVAASTLLGELEQPAGFQEVGQLDPLVNITLVPKVNSAQVGILVTRLTAAFLEQCNSLLNVIDTAHEDGAARVVVRQSLDTTSLSIGHLTVKVGHEHEAISLHQSSDTCKLLVVSGHSLVVHVNDIGIGADKEPLIGGGHGTRLGIPVGHVPVSATIVVTGPVTSNKVGAPIGKLVSAIGIELKVCKTLIIAHDLV